MRDQSLKAFIPELGELVGMTRFALYERLRVLARAGLLKAVPGHGAGTGVRATPQTVATLLVAILSTDDLADTAERAKTFAGLKSSDPCRLTGKTRFVDAVAEVLRLKLDATVGVGRRDQVATIFDRDGVSHFGKPLPKGGVDVGANLTAATLKSIAEAMEG